MFEFFGIIIRIAGNIASFMFSELSDLHVYNIHFPASFIVTAKGVYLKALRCK